MVLTGGLPNRKNGTYAAPTATTDPDIGFLKCKMFNARSLCNKMNELKTFVNYEKPDLLFITETWLNSFTPDSLIVHELNYSIFRKDRPHSSRGGGVCIMSRNDTVSVINVPLLPVYESLELVVMDILSSHSPIRIFLCYRAPSSDYDSDALNNTTLLCECIESLLQPHVTALILGDFNFPRINWTRNTSLFNSNTCTGIFLDFVNKHAFHQFVSVSTRIDSVFNNESLLDIVLSNDVNFVHNVEVNDPFSNSDHSVVSFDIINSCKHFVQPTSYHDFNKADWESIISYLREIDFNDVFLNCDNNVSNCVESFYNILYTCINQYVPLRLVGRQRNSAGNGCLPKHIRRLLTKKRAAWRKYRKSRTDSNLSRHKSLAKRVRSAINERVAQHEEALIEGNNFNKMYTYINRKFNISTPIGPLLDNTGTLINEPSAKAELLQNTFTSNFTIDNGQLPSMNVQNSCNIDTVVFSPSVVKRVVSKLKNKVKGGPDGIPAIFLKKCVNELCSPISFIFSLCMTNGYIPPDWLRSYIAPIPKKGISSDPSSYRPISLTCLLCKIMESVIKDQLLSSLLSNNVISKHQHGFLTKRSTLTNLLESTRDWSLSFSNTVSNDVIFIDFSKAFDSVVLNKLIFKLESYGIKGDLLSWIKVFLFNREQCVLVENAFSSPCEVISGVPQGSVLGPILFILFINDIVNVCNNNVVVTLYADDVKVYSTVSSGDTVFNLQSTLANLQKWASAWQLKINISKCQVLRIGGKCNMSSCFSINDHILPSSSSVSDLGVIVDNKLSYSEHINSIVTKCNQRIGMFFRGFVSRDFKMLSKFFTTYIRPILEYNSCVWNPSVKYLIDLLENVQRKFTKRINSISHLSYLERLSILNLEPLELRRLKADLTMYYKIINNLTCIDSKLVFAFRQPSLRTNRLTSHRFALQKPAKSLQTLSNSFFYRAIDVWNGLPDDVFSANSLPTFKNHINKIDFNAFLIGSVFS